jgi:hypothetical protein
MDRTKRVIIFIGRENLAKDSDLQQRICSFIDSEKYSIFNDPTDDSGHVSQPTFYFKHLVKTILGSFGIWEVTRDYLKRVLGFANDLSEINRRLVNLEAFLKGFPPQTEFTLVARSAGGIVCAKICSIVPINQVICLGYPFVHPSLGHQAYRTEALVNLTTSMTIFQGLQDSYGGVEVREKFPLTPKINLHFLDTDHDFVMSEAAWANFGKLFKSLL